MNLYFQYLNRLFYFIFLIYHKCLYLISRVFQKKIEYISPEKIYYNSISEKFQKYISENREDKNNNIHPIFYQQKEYNEVMKIENNNIESLWKTRILMDYNPRGNIIMFYDPYKMGFSYYCDQNVVPYDILNAVAMKYVTMYKCYFFFMDEMLLPEKNPLKMHYLENKKEEITNKEPEKKENKSLKNESFVKLKNYKVKDSLSMKNEPNTKIKNKFIYLGNIRNFKITQPIVKNKSVKGFQSPLLDGLQHNFSYTEFKKMKQLEKEKTN